MQKLFKIFIFLYLTITSAYGASLSLDDKTEPIFYLRNSTGENLNELFYNLGGDGSTPEAAITLYVPLSLGTGTQDFAYYTADSGGLSPNLADETSELGGLYLQDVDSLAYTNEELYVALKDNDNSNPAFRIVTQIPSSQVEAPFVSFADICSTSELNCAGITDSIASIKDSVELVLFFMPNDTDYSSNEEVEIPDAVGRAIYFKLVISAAATDIRTRATLNIIGTYAGDQTAVIEYTGDHGGNGAYISRMALYVQSGGGVVTRNINDIRIVEDQSNEGNVKVTNLTNNTTYSSAISYLDHFGYVGPGSVSNADLATQTGNYQLKPIEKLLSQNQCYLVTAGFQRDHYVLNYFRVIRDEYLMKTTLGAAFVDFYYSSAPFFVETILNNKALASMVKRYSFSMYFILQNILFIIGCMTIITLLTFRRELTYAVQSFNRR
ncbi:CFI-box-CTERM domain-containing protein [Halobacteriovorax sp. RT-2-1]|uniref:CFI-box-CTERM domain-containing protein n=1 Tax=Halobacteriovorax sp. RT-2-1 TaxID=3391164 RepID=UPI00399BF9AF